MQRQKNVFSRLLEKMKICGSTLTPAIEMNSKRLALSYNAILCVFGFGLLLFAYSSMIGWLYKTWLNNMAYSHGFIIPFIAIYLVWIKKDLFVGIPKECARIAGLSFCFFAGCLLFFGRRSAIIQIETLSLFFMLPGLVLYFYGWKQLRYLVFPILYLNFMISWAEIIFDKIHFPFQLIAAKIAAMLLEIYNIPAFLSGKYIQLPNITLFVAEECSGVRFFSAVLALAIPLVYMTQKTYLRAFVVIVFGVAITIFANGLRVSVAGVMGYHFGPELLHGPGHIFRGWSVAVFGWIALFLFNSIVAKAPTSKKHSISNRWKKNINRQKRDSIKKESPSGLRSHMASHGVIIILGVAFVLVLHIFAPPRPSSTKKDFAGFPLAFDGWTGKQRKWLPLDWGKNAVPDDELERVYQNVNGHKVYLYIAYFEKQTHDHRIAYGLPGIAHRDYGTISISNKFVAKETKIDYSSDKYQLFFWYQTPSSSITENYDIKLYAIKSALKNKSNNIAAIMIGVLDDPMKNDGLDDQTEEFIRTLIRVIESNII